jgi:hypothetical protein
MGETLVRAGPKKPALVVLVQAKPRTTRIQRMPLRVGLQLVYVFDFYCRAEKERMFLFDRSGAIKIMASGAMF